MTFAYSIDSYDRDGDLLESGFYLHFDDTRIRIGQNLEVELIIEEIFKKYGEI